MKKKFLSLIIMCIMAMSVMFVGCGKAALKDNPATDANVISNGGMTVIKGDYLYYVNGYVDETTLVKGDNKEGEIQNAGIYRTKISDGEIIKDKDGFVRDENGNSKTECVVSKIVGFSNGGFYILDDYIYYATPYMKYNTQGLLQNARIEFHRINIDGTKDKVICNTPESSSDTTTIDWTMYTIDGVHYIAYYSNSKVVVVNTETQKEVVQVDVASDQSYAFFKQEDYKTGMDDSQEFQNYIYYTRAITADDNYSANYKGNVISRVNVATGEISRVHAEIDSTYAIVKVDANNIYYTKTKTNGLKLLYKRNISSNFVNATEEQMTKVEYNNYYICDYGDKLLLASNSEGTFIIENNKSRKALSTERTIVAVDNNYAYYIQEAQLFRFDITQKIVGSEEYTTALVTDENKVHTLTGANHIDFDGQRVYVYVDYTAADSNIYTYLNYVDDIDGERFVGEFEDNHLPKVPEQDEKYGEDPLVEYIPHID